MKTLVNDTDGLQCTIHQARWDCLISIENDWDKMSGTENVSTIWHNVCSLRLFIESAVSPLNQLNNQLNATFACCTLARFNQHVTTQLNCFQQCQFCLSLWHAHVHASCHSNFFACMLMIAPLLMHSTVDQSSTRMVESTRTFDMHGCATNEVKLSLINQCHQSE